MNIPCNNHAYVPNMLEIFSQIFFFFLGIYNESFRKSVWLCVPEEKGTSQLQATSIAEESESGRLKNVQRGKKKGGERWCRQGLRGSNNFESGVHLNYGDGGGRKALPLIRHPPPP